MAKIRLTEIATPYRFRWPAWWLLLLNCGGQFFKVASDFGMQKKKNDYGNRKFFYTNYLFGLTLLSALCSIMGHNLRPKNVQIFAEHLRSNTWRPRINGFVERFVDTFKREPKKAKGTPTNTAIQQFLQVYKVTTNKNTPSVITPAEVVYARKISSVFDKLIPK